MSEITAPYAATESIAVSTSGSGLKELIAAAPGVGYVVTGYSLTAGGAADLTLQSGVRALTGAIPTGARVHLGMNNEGRGLFEVAVGAPLKLNVSASVTVAGFVTVRRIDSSTRILHVSSSGNDANGGYSEDDPLLTVAAVTSAYTADPSATHILFEAGATYNDATLALADVRNLTVTRFGTGADPILHGANARTCITIDGSTSLLIAQLEMRQTDGKVVGANGIDIAGANGGLVVSDCYMHHCEHAIQCAAGPSGEVSVLDSTAHRCWGDGLSLSGSIAGTFQRCTVTETGYDDSSVANGTGGAGDAMTSHVSAFYVAEDCTLTGNLRTIYNIDANTDPARKNVLRRCFITANDSASIVAQQNGTTRLEACKIICTGSQPTLVFQPNTGGTVELDGVTVLNKSSHASGGTLSAQSTLVANRCVIRATAGALHAADFGTNFSGSNNCYFPATSGLWVKNGLQDLAGWQAETGEDADSLDVDPVLVSDSGTTAADLDLQAGSPCRGAGGARGIAFDYSSRMRPATADIGAHQYGSTSDYGDPAA